MKVIRIVKETEGEKEISNLSDLGLNPRKRQEVRDRVVDSRPSPNIAFEDAMVAFQELKRRKGL